MIAPLGEDASHNEGNDKMTNAGGVAGEQLRSLVERIERLEEERGGIAGDIRDIYAEAKASGFDVKTMRQVIRLRKMEKADRDEQEALLDLYRHALGMEFEVTADAAE
jgi:uncharacterized protein (UPF0335 family)